MTHFLDGRPSGLLVLLAVFAPAVLAVSLAACGSASGPRPDPVVAEIDGIVIRNGLNYPVHDVMVEVPATGAFAGCGMILRRSRCSTPFPAAAYRREALVIRWTERGAAHDSGEVVLDPPAGAGAPASAWLEVVIFAPGQAGARLVSDPEP